MTKDEVIRRFVNLFKVYNGLIILGHVDCDHLEQVDKELADYIKRHKDTEIINDWYSWCDN